MSNTLSGSESTAVISGMSNFCNTIDSTRLVIMVSSWLTNHALTVSLPVAVKFVQNSWNGAKGALHI